MIFIAHRGLTDGPNRLRENTVEQILRAKDEGFDTEFDLWFYQDNWWLGHDEPTHLLNYASDDPTAKRLFGKTSWLHPKNVEALEACYEVSHPDFDCFINFFWHDKDRFTLTSRGVLMQNINESEAIAGGIIAQPELHDFFSEDSHLSVATCERFLRQYAMQADGVMTKYPRMFREAWGRIVAEQQNV